VLTASATDLWNWRLDRLGFEAVGAGAITPEHFTLESLAAVSSVRNHP
jgi:hypothetical protein